ncbi:MAG: polysaccharide biosynthesis tyrosine autokinase [Candidatus Omnitrophica bacterium]|nr:polysaccharide biosynthesis tyrosine autokinase [Candidatus Omnitrophota bacterium]
MAEYELNLWDYWRIVYKRKWIIITIFLASLLSSYLFVEKVDPIYRSTVTLYINTTRTPVAEITGSGVTFWGGGSQSISTQLELIKSFKVLKRVAERLGMVTGDSSDGEIQRAVSSLKGRITVSRDDQATELFDISAISEKPGKAKEIADVTARVFIEKRWEDKIREARNTKEFIQEQLRKLDARTTEIRQKLAAVGVEPADPSVPGIEVDLLARLEHLKLELRNLQTRFTENYPGIIALKEQIKAVREQIGYTPGETEQKEETASGDVRKGIIDAERLSNELEINKKLYALLKERYERALILEASKSSDVEIVNPAVEASSAFTGQGKANFYMAGVIGLILGLVAAFVAESLDTSIGTIEDVEEYLRIPVLGVIPQIDIDKKEERDFWKRPPSREHRKEYDDMVARLVTQLKPKSPVAEAYRNLQTYIKFSGLDKVGNCLMITSASSKEGKTITSLNSALSMAQMGYKVLLIDADLRKPSIHKIFGIEREVGLTEAVLGTFKVDDVVKTMDDIMLGNLRSSMIMKTYGMENLNIITSGHLPTNSTEILGSQNMSEFIKEVKSKFQVVLFDTAPVLPVTDPCVLGSKVDGVVIVYKSGRISRSALKRSKLQIENAKGRPIGVVLNSMRASDMKFGSPFYYYYQKYYGEEEQGNKGPSSGRTAVS